MHPRELGSTYANRPSMSLSGPSAASARESAVPDAHAGVPLLARIGNTPLLRLDRVGSNFSNIEFCAKAEWFRSEEHTSELQSQSNLVCRLLLEKKKNHA